MQRKFTVTFHKIGDMGANMVATFIPSSGCKLVHVSACQSDADAAGLTIGDDSDPDEHLTVQSIGVSGVPLEFDGDDFVDSDGNTHARYYPQIAAGETVVVGVDYDYNAGAGSGDAADVTIVLTFVEGGV